MVLGTQIKERRRASPQELAVSTIGGRCEEETALAPFQVRPQLMRYSKLQICLLVEHIQQGSHHDAWTDWDEAGLMVNTLWILTCIVVITTIAIIYYICVLLLYSHFSAQEN